MGEAGGGACSDLEPSPKPLCFPPRHSVDPLFLFLFCCRFNSSRTLSVLLERYLVSSPCVAPSPPAAHCPLSQQDKAGRAPLVQGQALIPISKALAPTCPMDSDCCPHELLVTPTLRAKEGLCACTDYQTPPGHSTQLPTLSTHLGEAPSRTEAQHSLTRHWRTVL